MEITGLCHGNYIHTPEGIKAITGVVEHDVMTEDGNLRIISWKGGRGRAVYCKPVELTPEILEACGFKKMSDIYYAHSNDILLNFDSVWWWTNSWEPDGEFEYEAKVGWKEIESLHRLQNLYYSLTCTHLAVNLKEAQEG